MRILMIQPNYHAGGAEIAGNWSPSWVPYVGGALKAGVLRNYARFYGWKFWEYWWERDSFKRRYLLGCLWAFVQTTWNKRFYNLSRVKRRGLHAEIDLGFDDARILSAEAMAQIKAAKLTDVEFTEVAACGGPSTLPTFSDWTVRSFIWIQA